jgi:hypothetical protein
VPASELVKPGATYVEAEAPMDRCNLEHKYRMVTADGVARDKIRDKHAQTHGSNLGLLVNGLWQA